MRQIVKLFLCGVFVVLSWTLLVGERTVVAFSGGPDPGNTGAPGESTCAGCHSGGPLTGELRLTGVPATYAPNEEVTLTVTLLQGNRQRYGFQLTAIDDDGKTAGTLIVSDANRTQLRSTPILGNDRQYIEHTLAGSSPFSAGSGSWTFRWKAPAATTGKVTFYLAGNAANGDFTSFGDSIYTINASSAAPATIAALASVSAASFTSGASVAANSIVAAFAAGNVLASDVALGGSIPLPETLLGTSVRVTDSAGVERAAGLFFVSPGQINLEIPGETASGMATVKVVRNSQAVAQGTVQIDSVSPGIFRVIPSLRENILGALQIYRAKPSGAGIEDIIQFDAALQQFIPIPIEFGPEPEVIFLLIYGTGIRGRSSQAAVTATLGGVQLPVEYADIAPGYVGLDQVNLNIPRNLAPRGNLDLFLTIDGKVSNTVVVNIK